MVVAVIFVKLDIGPNRGGLGLDLSRTATREWAGALSSTAGEVRLNSAVVCSEVSAERYMQVTGKLIPVPATSITRIWALWALLYIVVLPP